MIEAVPLPKWKSSVPVKEPVASLRATNAVGAGVAGAADGAAEVAGVDGAGVGGAARCRVRRRDRRRPGPARRARSGSTAARPCSSRTAGPPRARCTARTPARTGCRRAAANQPSRQAIDREDDGDDDRPDQDGDPVRVQPVEERALELVEVRHVSARVTDADDGPMTGLVTARGVGGVRWQPHNGRVDHGNEEAQAVGPGAAGRLANGRTRRQDGAVRCRVRRAGSRIGRRGEGGCRLRTGRRQRCRRSGRSGQGGVGPGVGRGLAGVGRRPAGLRRGARKTSNARARSSARPMPSKPKPAPPSGRPRSRTSTRTASEPSVARSRS